MKNIIAFLIVVLCVASASGQTIRTLGYNTTNGQVIYSGTNTLTFTNPVVVGGDIVISNAFLTFGAASIDLEEAQLEVLGSPVFQWADVELTANVPLTFNTTTNAAATRTNLSLGATWLTNTNVTNFRTAIGLPLAALTNTSNVTAMRALAGSTNTNEPFSGVIQYADHPEGDAYNLTFSNGILLKKEGPL